MVGKKTINKLWIFPPFRTTFLVGAPLAPVCSLLLSLCFLNRASPQLSNFWCSSNFSHHPTFLSKFSMKLSHSSCCAVVWAALACSLSFFDLRLSKSNFSKKLVFSWLVHWHLSSHRRWLDQPRPIPCPPTTNDKAYFPPLKPFKIWSFEVKYDFRVCRYSPLSIQQHRIPCWNGGGWVGCWRMLKWRYQAPSLWQLG